MELILRENVEKVGKIGEVVTVANGYGRNYLIPKKLGFPATPENKKVLEREMKLKKEKEEKEKKEAEALVEKISSLSCTIPVQVGEEGKLFGAVTVMDIEKSIRLEGVEIDRRQIELEQNIKELGIYYVPVRLHPEVYAKVKVWVVKA